MNIKKYILTALNSDEILNLLPDKQVYFLHAINPNKDLYLEYEVINEYGAEYFEGEENYTTYQIQIDIFSVGDYTKLERAVKKVMLNYGFNREIAIDLYEKETGLFHKAMRFNISLPSDRKE